jgi:hypothetical protein
MKRIAGWPRRLCELWDKPINVDNHILGRFDDFRAFPFEPPINRIPVIGLGRESVPHVKFSGGIRPATQDQIADGTLIILTK